MTFDEHGRPHFGTPLTGTDGTNVLFPLPRAAVEAGANNALPAGSITTRDGRTFMMVVGTNTNEGLMPKGGSWMVEVTNNPAAGWKPSESSYKPWESIANPQAGLPGQPPRISNPDMAPTQISGYQGSDGKVYIAADGFDRHQGVAVYRVDPDQIADRGAWQPWTGNDWGNPGEVATNPITPPGQNWGEISFREVDGRPVLAGTNFNNDFGNTRVPTVEVHVGATPTQVVDATSPPTVVMSNDAHSSEFVAAPYGGYILPGSTLDNLGLFGSQWYQPRGAPVHYDVQDIHVNVEPGQR